MPREWDVVVVGAGPAGSASATLLSRAGYRVCVLDRARFPRHKSCAEYLSPGVLEVLTRIGLDTALTGADYQPVPGMDIVSASGTRLRVQYRRHDRSFMAATLPRLTFDARLLEAAADAGTEVREGITVHAPLIEGGIVRGVKASSDGRDVDIRGAVTVIADGARSTLARRLGLATPAKWPVRLGLVAHYEGDVDFHEGHGQMHVGTNGYCGVAPLPGGRSNVAMVVRADELRRSRLPASEYFQKWIESMPRLRAMLGAARPVTPVRGVSPIGSRCRRAWTDGAVLTGDAASFFDPFTGEGIYRALRGAELVVQTIAESLERGDVRAASLAPYGHLRRAAFARKSAVTALVQAFVQYPRLMEYGLPRLAAREAPAATLGLVLGDVADAAEFLRPRTLWAALRP